MHGSTISIIYLILSALLCALVFTINKRTGISISNGNSERVYLFGMIGRHGAGAIAVDRNGVLTIVVLIALIYGAGMGFFIPTQWIVSDDPGLLIRASQVIGAVLWAAICVQSIGWIFPLIGLLVGSAIVAAICFVPYQYLRYGAAATQPDNLPFSHLDKLDRKVRQKIEDWRVVEAHRISKVPMPKGWNKFVGEWPGDGSTWSHSWRIDKDGFVTRIADKTEHREVYTYKDGVISIVTGTGKDTSLRELRAKGQDTIEEIFTWPGSIKNKPDGRPWIDKILFKRAAVSEK